MRKLSTHLRLEIAAAQQRGGGEASLPPTLDFPAMRPGVPREEWRTRLASPAALEPGEPVPGCACERCTGLPDDHPARVPAWRRKNPGEAARSDAERRRRWARTVEEARRVPIAEVARRLGLGEPRRAGQEVRVRCPLHEDADPSLRLNPPEGVWYCDPCGEGGDGIRLVERALGLDFAAAVRELTGEGVPA